MTDLQNTDIVLLSHQRWNTHVTAVQNTVVRLARDNRVLFFEPPDSVAWLPSEPAAREALSWILSPLERKTANLSIYHTPPVFLPGQGRSRWIARSITLVYETMIRRACRKIGFSQPIFWVFQFNTAGVVRVLKPRFTVYECAEEWDAYETNPQTKEYIRAADADLCRTADLVVVPSREMLRIKKQHNPSTHLVPWGVDLDLYSRALQPDTIIPDDIRNIPHPIIGMFGMLDGRRLHTELLRHLASRHPDWSLVLVGRCMPNLGRSILDTLPNVYFLGMKPVEQIPAYCKAFDVCMIPYIINEFTRSIMPLKLVEYLATGKAIVSTALPAAEELRDVIHVAEDISTFERHVAVALDDPIDMPPKRLARATEYDWNVMVRRKMDLVMSHLNGQPSREPADRLP